MQHRASTLVLLCMMASAGAAQAADQGGQDNSPVMAGKSPVAQEKDACERQEQQQGTSAPASTVKCVVKVLFQSRIRRRKDEEPVEMTAGSPPLQTDDTETPGAGNLEINFGLQGDAGGGQHRVALPLVEINYGVGDTLQFSYAVPYLFSRQPGTDPADTSPVSVHGVGDSTLGLKYRLYDNTDTGVSFAIAPEIEFRTPGGNRRLSEGTTLTVLPFIMTREFEHASLTANAGVELSTGQQRYFGSFAVGRRLNDTTALLAEIAGNNLNFGAEQHVLLNVGLRRKISGSQSITGSLGRDVHAGGDEHKLVYFNLTYQKIFGE